MFEISVSELMVLAVVGLVVVGPERLPRVARAAGLFLGRMRRYANDVKADIEREMCLDELKRARNEFEESIWRISDDLDTESRQVEQVLDEGMKPLRMAFQAQLGKASGEAGEGENLETPPVPEASLRETAHSVSPADDAECTVKCDAP